MPHYLKRYTTSSHTTETPSHHTPHTPSHHTPHIHHLITHHIYTISSHTTYTPSHHTPHIHHLITHHICLTTLKDEPANKHLLHISLAEVASADEQCHAYTPHRRLPYPHEHRMARDLVPDPDLSTRMLVGSVRALGCADENVLMQIQIHI
jgi:hypothetical protein